MELPITTEELRLIKQAVSHEINDNSYCKCQAHSPQLRERLEQEGRMLVEIETKLNNILTTK